MSILHVTNGDSARALLERSGLPGTVIAWPDILHEGPTPLVDGEEWMKVRSRYLVRGGYAAPVDEPDGILPDYRTRSAALESYADHEEVVFWFEQDLFDQLLLIRHLWWLGAKGANGAEGAKGAGAEGAKGAGAEGATGAGATGAGATGAGATGAGATGAGAKGAGAKGARAMRFGLVCGEQYLGMLKPQDFAPLFEARQPITAAQIDLGTRAWRAFTGADPTGLLPFATGEHLEIPYLTGAIRRHLEEFPSTLNGLARSERQILQVLSEGLRTPEETIVEASRLEDHIFMGDASFWTIVRRLSEGPRPLVTAAVQPREGRLPLGTLALTGDGASVLAGRADHLELNGIDRWLGGVRLTSERLWRWTGSTLRPSPSTLPPAS